MSVSIESGFFGSHTHPDRMLACRVSVDYGLVVEGVPVDTKRYALEVGRVDGEVAGKLDATHNYTHGDAVTLLATPHYSTVRVFTRAGGSPKRRYVAPLQQRATTSVGVVSIPVLGNVLTADSPEADYDILARHVASEAGQTEQACHAMLFGGEAVAAYLDALARANVDREHPARLLARTVLDGELRHEIIGRSLRF